MREEVDRSGFKPHAIVLEPIARNTAPAIAVAALVALKDNPNAILAIMPSDHVVKDEKRFAEGVKRAAEVAASGKLVLFGSEADRTAYRLRLHQAGRRTSRASRALPTPSRTLPKSPTAPPPKPTSRPASISGTAAFSF